MKGMNNGKCVSRVLALAGAMLLIALHTAFAIPQRPEPARLVNDLAGLFSSSQTEHLERMLVAFDDSTSNQIAVVTVADLEGYDAAEYATRIGLDWGVGSEKFDNGVVILVKPKTTSSGQVFIAVGYGLEGAIPDAYAKRIINNEMIPHFMQNDYFGGVYEACEIIMKLASGEISEMREYEEDDTARDPLADALELTEAIGVDAELTGMIPQEDPDRKILAAAVSECASNTVKHADGDQLKVIISRTDTEWVCVLQNNGLQPKEAIRESGGLLSLRTLVEKEGGSMQTRILPEYAITIRLPK
jgi:uncharacterized membrane protein YgcG